MTEDEMAGCHHRLDGHEFEQTLGVGGGQRGLVCCDSWGHKEADTTERLNSSAFSKSSLNIWKFTVHVLLKPGLENLSMSLLVCKMSAIVWQFEQSLALPSFGTGMKTDRYQSRGHC